MLKRLTRLDSAPPWSVTTAVGMVIAMFAAIVLGTTLAQLLLPESPAQPLIGWIIGGVLTIALIFFSRYRTLEERTAFKLGPTRSALPIILLLSFAVALLIDLISLVITGNFWPVLELISFFSDGGGYTLLPRADLTIAAWVLAVLLLVIVQPLAEELVFRGLIFPALRISLGALSGFLMTAVFHAAFHVLAYTPFQLNGLTPFWYALIVPLLDALFITGVRAYTSSTRAAIVAHVAFGMFAILKALAVVG